MAAEAPRDGQALSSEERNVLPGPTEDLEQFFDRLRPYRLVENISGYLASLPQ